MGIFTRFRDIISANINSMLDRAEDPEKMIKLIIREMEDTLVELKASCAGLMAEKKKLHRRLEEAQTREAHWKDRASMAVDKGRDDLAREALLERRRFARRTESLEHELFENDVLVNQYHTDIRQLEEKLGKAREKQRMLVHRHIRARQAQKAQEEIRRVDNYETIAKFDELETRIERMEADAELVNFGRKPALDAAFEEILADEDIEKELAALKASHAVPENASAS